MSTAAAISESSSAALPDDVATLKALIRELLSSMTKLKGDNERLRHRLDQLLRRVYGQKSEKLDPAQLLLFVDEDLPSPSELPAESSPAAAETETITVTQKKGHGRRSLPADLPRVRKLHDLTDAEKLCSCCQTPRTKIGEDVSEQLEFVPASLFVIEHVTPKYVCPNCRDGIASALKPEQPIDKGLPGPGLLAHVAVSKYADHLPLNRQEKIFRRHGVTLNRSTLCDWMMSVAEMIQPLVDLMRIEILNSRLIQTDDTPVDVLDRDQGKKSKPLRPGRTVRTESVDRAQSLSRPRRAADRQQRQRTRSARRGLREKQLALLRQRPRRTCRGDDPVDHRHLPAPRRRTVRISPRSAGPLAHAAARQRRPPDR